MRHVMGVTASESGTATEKEAQIPRPKPDIRVASDTVLHCSNRLQRTTLNAFEIAGFVLTIVLTDVFVALFLGCFTYETGEVGQKNAARFPLPANFR